MPLVRISLQSGRTHDEKESIAQNLYEAMRETIGIPENDKFIVLNEHGPDTLFVDRSFMGIERSDKCLVVEITLRRGRTLEMKQALYARIAERLQSHGGVRKEDVVVVLRENDTADWSFGNGMAQYTLN